LKKKKKEDFLCERQASKNGSIREKFGINDEIIIHFIFFFEIKDDI